MAAALTTRDNVVAALALMGSPLAAPGACVLLVRRCVSIALILVSTASAASSVLFLSPFVVAFGWRMPSEVCQLAKLLCIDHHHVFTFGRFLILLCRLMLLLLSLCVFLSSVTPFGVPPSAKAVAAATLSTAHLCKSSTLTVLIS